MTGTKFTMDAAVTPAQVRRAAAAAAFKHWPSFAATSGNCRGEQPGRERGNGFDAEVAKACWIEGMEFSSVSPRAVNLPQQVFAGWLRRCLKESDWSRWCRYYGLTTSKGAVRSSVITAVARRASLE